MKKLKVLPSMHCDTGCGECCGPAPATETELRRVEKYAHDNGITALDQGITCPFFQNGTCAVYKVRPFSCQLFGHSEDEGLTCPRGYNVNIPLRDAMRMKTANGTPTRFLHELIPGFGLAEAEWRKASPTKIIKRNTP